MEPINLLTVKKDFTVEASQETSFKVFTQHMDRWWPRTHHVGATPMTGMIVEPNTGGRWYTTHEDGAEMLTGYVLTWQPFEQVVLSWQLNATYQFDPELVTEVSVTFIPIGPTTTRVAFEHRNLERLNSNATADGMNEGWGMILDLYVAIAEKR